MLVRVEAAPINPADLIFIAGHYSSDKKPPCTPGMEGSGVVVSAGSGPGATALVGKRIAFVEGKHGTGSWGEYILLKAESAIPIPEEVSLETAACSFVNPVTVLLMLETVKEAGVKTVVSTAAASALGRMLVRLFQSEGIDVINIVRR